MRTAVQVGLHDLALNGILADEMGKLLHLSYCALQTGIFLSIERSVAAAKAPAAVVRTMEATS